MSQNQKTDAQTTPAVTPAVTPAEPKRELTIEELNSIMGGAGDDDGGAGFADGSAGFADFTDDMVQRT